MDVIAPNLPNHYSYPKMKLPKFPLFLLPLFGFPFLLWGLPQDQQVFSNLEGISGSFTLGTTPNTAQFTGGNVQFLGISRLYHSGTRSWMIANGVTGTITFETPASVVEFYAGNQSSTSDGTISVFDTNDNLLTTVTSLVLVPVAPLAIIQERVPE